MANSCAGWDNSAPPEIQELIKQRIRANPAAYKRGSQERTHLDQDDSFDGVCACLLQDLDSPRRCEKGQCQYAFDGELTSIDVETREEYRQKKKVTAEGSS